MSVGNIYKITKTNTEYWYDFSTRCWWTAAFIDGNQQGDAQHAYTKNEIIELAESL